MAVIDIVRVVELFDVIRKWFGPVWRARMPSAAGNITLHEALASGGAVRPPKFRIVPFQISQVVRQSSSVALKNVLHQLVPAIPTVKLIYLPLVRVPRPVKAQWRLSFEAEAVIKGVKKTQTLIRRGSGPPIAVKRNRPRRRMRAVFDRAARRSQARKKQHSEGRATNRVHLLHPPALLAPAFWFIDNNRILPESPNALPRIAD